MNYTYRYSATESSEARRIREKYLPKSKSKLDELRALDKKVREAGNVTALIVGIVGCLIFGVGICMGLGALPGGMVVAIILGLIGTIVMLPAYPIYLKLKRDARERYSPRIIELASEIESTVNN